MAKATVGVRLKGMMTAMFNDAARTRLCESSGSEHYSPHENSADLSDLVNSFLERDSTISIQGENTNHDQDKGSKDNGDLESYCWSDSENKTMLQNLLNNIQNEDDFRSKIREIACGIIGERSSHDFKRRLMSRLRYRGFDCGLCKTRWGKFGRHPPGEYEYVDVNVGGNRFIVEVLLEREFEIARPTKTYTGLLNYFPQVFIGKAEDLKQIVRLMCDAMRLSMKEMDLHVPPWRRNGYMQAKWFSPYKRTVNEIPTKSWELSDEAFSAKRYVGFEASLVKSYKCSDNFITQAVGLKVGYLTVAFNGTS